MKRLIALAISLTALSGCHVNTCHYDSDGSYHCTNDYYHHNLVTTTTYYGEDTTNIIVVEEDHYDTCDWDQPYYHDAEWCSFDGITCCAWSQVTNSVEYVYCYFDYCGWDLVEINEYY